MVSVAGSHEHREQDEEEVKSKEMRTRLHHVTDTGRDCCRSENEQQLSASRMCATVHDLHHLIHGHYIQEVGARMLPLSGRGNRGSVG